MVATPTTSAPQIRRVARYYKKFERFDGGVEHDRPTDERVDDIYAFFLNCYHLKDWIKKDPALESLGKVEQFIHGKGGVSPCLELQVCGDLCNAAKHFTHDNKSKVDPQPGPRHFSLGLTIGESASVSAKVVIETDTGPLDAFELATKCMDAWSGFLKMDIRNF